MAFFKKDPPPPPPKTFIDAGASLKGTLKSRHEIVLAGAVSGEVSSEGRIHIEAGGRADGRLRCRDFRCDGRADGTLEASGLAHFTPSSAWQGNLTAARLRVEPGAALRGSLKEGPAR